MAEKIVPKKIMKGIRFYTVSDLAKVLDITEYSARVYLRDGRISAVKVAGKWFIREKSLNDFLLCRNIREMPDDQLMAMINKAVELRFEMWIEKAIPLLRPVMQKVVTEFLIKKEKEKFKVNIKKVEKKNKELKKVLPDKIVKKLMDRETKLKKDFEKVK